MLLPGQADHHPKAMAQRCVEHATGAGPCRCAGRSARLPPSAAKSASTTDGRGIAVAQVVPGECAVGDTADVQLLVADEKRTCRGRPDARCRAARKSRSGQKRMREIRATAARTAQQCRLLRASLPRRSSVPIFLPSTSVRYRMRTLVQGSNRCTTDLEDGSCVSPGAGHTRLATVARKRSQKLRPSVVPLCDRGPRPVPQGVRVDADADGVLVGAVVVDPRLRVGRGDLRVELDRDRVRQAERLKADGAAGERCRARRAAGTRSCATGSP